MASRISRVSKRSVPDRRVHTVLSRRESVVCMCDRVQRPVLSTESHAALGAGIIHILATVPSGGAMIGRILGGFLA